MAVIETKFSVGDVVWHANITTAVKQHPCPDCLGSRCWEARSPAGGVFAVDCPRCSTNYMSNHALNLKYSVWTPTARRLTIGMVRAGLGTDAEHEYMCHETGIGSGSIYRESTLFVSEAEALACAETKAALNNVAAEGWVAKQYNETARFCDYQLKDAQMEAAIAAARQSQHRVGYLVEDLREAETMSDVRRAIETWDVRAEEAA